MELQNVLYEARNRIAYVTVNRPKVLNALNDQTMEELKHIFLDIRHRSDALAAILTGAGGGCELAMACTVRLASDNAKLGQPEVKLGIMAGYGGTQRLVRLVGMGRALELLLSGEQISAQRAYEIGLVNAVFPQAELITQAENFIGKMLANGPIALKLTLEAAHRGMQMTLEEGLNLEASLFGLICTTEDMKEGTKAFLEKRSPQFKNR